MCGAKAYVRFAPDSDRKSGLPQTVMSALPPKADMCGALADVRYGPKADIAASATHREAKLILLIVQIATAATRPALANTPDTTAALNRITPNA